MNKASVVTLVFPSTMTEAIDFSRQAKNRGERVLAASSLQTDETAKYYDEWVYLPLIYDEDFVPQFMAVVRQYGITHFYTPHAVVYTRVKKLVEEHDLEISLVRQSPIQMLDEHYRHVIERSLAAQDFIRAIDGDSRLSLMTVAALFHHSGQMFGQSNESKIAAMAAVFHSAPKGDVIEVGAAWGRSAFALTFLARQYATGNVLCIDPWNSAIATQKESPAELDVVVHAFDWEMMFRIFRIHLMGYAAGDFNYLRTTSEDAAQHYARYGAVRSEEFGDTRYLRKIAVIHIDGNHDFEYVMKDYRLWSRFLVPGAWVIMDDYQWVSGDGPRRAGDLILQEKASEIDLAFTSGSALFLRFGKLGHVQEGLRERPGSSQANELSEVCYS